MIENEEKETETEYEETDSESESEEDIEDEPKYNKIIQVSLYFCAWLLSFVLLYTYNSKRASNIEYNKVMSRLNTTKLDSQINKYKRKVQEYYDNAFSENVMNSENDTIPVGISKIRRELYEETIKTVELYEKCNYIRMNTEGPPFPVSEVMISCILLLLILGIIVVSNLSNNPFKKLNISDETDELKDMIQKGFENIEPKQIISKGGSRSSSYMRGGPTSSSYLDKKEKYKQHILNQENLISTRINFLKSDATFNYVSLSFSIIIFSVYISYKMLISSLRFKENLYSGTTFIKSRCYDMDY